MNWLPDMDLNHDKQIQSLLCYRYTIGQSGGNKLEWRGLLSRLGSIGKVGRALRSAPIRNDFSMKGGAHGVLALPNPKPNRISEFGFVSDLGFRSSDFAGWAHNLPTTGNP